MGTLNKKNVIASYTFKINRANFSVTEFLNINPTELATIPFTN